MKLAQIVSRTLNRRKGKNITKMAPFAETLKEFKRRVSDNEFDDKYPLMEIWTDASGRVKSHKFRPAKPDAPDLGNDGEPGPEPGYAELKTEISRRNADREPEDEISKSGKKDDLIAALEADDAAAAEIEAKLEAAAQAEADAAAAENGETDNSPSEAGLFPLTPAAAHEDVPR